MIATKMVSSPLVDLRDRRLDDMSALTSEVIDEAIRRILPELVPRGAIFQSAI